MPEGKKLGKWSAISAAVIVPVMTSLLSYCESRDARRAAADNKAETSKVEGSVTDTREGARASYYFVKREFDRVWDAIEECHERVDELENVFAEHIDDRNLHKRTSSRPSYGFEPEPMSKARPSRGSLPDDIDTAQLAFDDELR